MSENSTLEKIFREYHLFSIPSYQRDYAWEIRNFEELWEDLKESIELENTDSDKGHFLGTIVVTPNNQNQNSVDVIDGQQRLTTTFMLLLALWEKLSEEKRDHIGKGFLYEDYKEKTYKLQVSESNREFFRQILESSNQAHLPSKGKLDIKPATQGQNNLYDVFNYILGKIKVFDSKEADSYFTKLINMRLICFKEHNAGAAIRTFQSVNDRGVPLRLLDKLKSLLIYYSNRYCVDDKLDSKINQNFGEIFRFSSQIFAHPYRSTIFATQSNEINDIERDVFRYHLTSKESFAKGMGFLNFYKASAENHYIEFKKAIKDLAQEDKTQNKALLKTFLNDYSDDLKAFFQATLDILKEIDTNEELFKTIMIENLNPMYYNTFIRLKIDQKLDKEMIRLFAKTDCILIKMNGKYRKSYDLIKKYQDKNTTLLTESIKDCIRGLNVESNINDFVKEAYNQTHKKVFHYLFIEKECKDIDSGYLKRLLTNEDNGKKITQEQEHIISQSVFEDDKKDIIEKKKFDNKDDLGNYINSYGNLLSLEKRLNGEARDKSDSEKREAYSKSALPFVRSFNPENINKQSIIKRNDEMKQWLKEEFFKDFL